MSDLPIEEIRKLFAFTRVYLDQQHELFGPSLPDLITSPEISAEAREKARLLDEFQASFSACQNCKLGKTRKNLVFGSGNPDARLLVIGEGPGADEDETGYPFVGRAGQLLTAILKAIQFTRQDVYIANIVKCRPPQNRKPEPDEVAECMPYLKNQIRIIRPSIILALGATAANTLLNNTDSLGSMRGKIHTFEGTPLIVTYHPAALLRNPNYKPDTWQDVQFLRKQYDLLVR